MPNTSMTIGALAEAAGVHVPTIRYYERRGLIPKPSRGLTGYRQYDQAALDRIRFIKRAQSMGFSLEDIQALLALRVRDPAACPVVEEATRSKLADVEAKIGSLERLRVVLDGLVRSCQQREPTAECPVLAILEEGEVK